MPLHLRELPKGQRFVLMRTGDKFVYLGVGVSPYSGSYQHLCQRESPRLIPTSRRHLRGSFLLMQDDCTTRQS